jgi:hypothetical protein
MICLIRGCGFSTGTGYPPQPMPNFSHLLQVGFPSSHLTRRVLSWIQLPFEEINIGETYRHVKHPVLTFGVFLLSLWRCPGPCSAASASKIRPAFRHFAAEAAVAGFDMDLSDAIAHVVEKKPFSGF